MSCVNSVHDFDGHDLRGIVRASRFSYIGVILGVFFDGKFNRESSVIPVKLDGKKDSLINPYKKTFTVRQHVREIMEQAFVPRAVTQMPIRFFEVHIQKKVHEG
jgi:hypothetical protein